jgi:hypothetical protein
MKLFFTIVGGMVVGFLLIVLIVYLLFRFWMRRMMKGLAEMAKTATLGIVPFTQPLRITLNREYDSSWNDHAAVDRIVRSLTAAGFEDAGDFAILEVPDFRLRALSHPEKSVYAAICEHPDIGIWFELVSRYEDGSMQTYTTGKEKGIDHPPNRFVERFEAEINPAELYEQHVTRRPDKPLLPASAERFAADYEQAYADEMDWRFERGGTTEEEVRKTLMLQGTETTEEQIKQVHAIQQAQVGQWLQVKLQENYRAKSGIADAKWLEIEHRVIFVHDRMTSDEVHGEFTNCLDWNEEYEAEQLSDNAEELAVGPAREAFVRMIEALPRGHAPTKIGHLTQPVAADVYLLKEQPEEDD